METIQDAYRIASGRSGLADADIRVIDQGDGWFVAGTRFPRGTDIVPHLVDRFVFRRARRMCWLPFSVAIASHPARSRGRSINVGVDQ